MGILVCKRSKIRLNLKTLLVPELSIYDSIGIVDINIEPHLDSASEDHMKDIHEASRYTTIYGIYDNTFIKVVNKSMEIYGDYFKHENISDK